MWMNKKQLAMAVTGIVLAVALVVVLINVYGQLGDLADGQDELGKNLNARYVELTEKIGAVGEDLAKLRGDADEIAKDLRATDVVLEERTVLFESALDDAEARYGLLQDALKDLEDAYRNAWEQAQEKITTLQRELAQLRSSLDALERRMAQMGGTTIKEDFSIPLTYVEGGTYQMGSNNNLREQPIHTVTVGSFYMGIYEVTQDIYEEVMGSNPSYSKEPQLPVEQVSWYEAVAFANALSQRDGLEEVYTIDGEDVVCDWSKNGYRLPTEAEWEYAARGGNQSQGYTYAGSDTAGDVAWYDGNSGIQTHDVGGKKANELGLYDMSGNVWEWCWDWYGDYSTLLQTNPSGPSSGLSRVFRGGSWDYHASFARSANRGSDASLLRSSLWHDLATYVRSDYRYAYASPYRRYNVGFRLVLPAD
jgi:formylglycine-generating enzyme